MKTRKGVCTCVEENEESNETKEPPKSGKEETRNNRVSKDPRECDRLVDPNFVRIRVRSVRFWFDFGSILVRSVFRAFPNVSHFRPAFAKFPPRCCMCWCVRVTPFAVKPYNHC